MNGDGALVDFSVMAMQVSGHELGGEIARIKDLEIKSEVDAGNTLEGVGMSLQEILQELSGIVEVASAVVKSKVAGAFLQNLEFVDIVGAVRLTSDLDEGLTIRKADGEHLLVHSCTIVTLYNVKAKGAEVVRVPRL